MKPAIKIYPNIGEEYTIEFHLSVRTKKLAATIATAIRKLLKGF